MLKTLSAIRVDFADETISIGTVVDNEAVDFTRETAAAAAAVTVDDEAVDFTREAAVAAVEFFFEHCLTRQYHQQRYYLILSRAYEMLFYYDIGLVEWCFNSSTHNTIRRRRGDTQWSTRSVG